MTFATQLQFIEEKRIPVKGPDESFERPVHTASAAFLQHTRLCAPPALVQKKTALYGRIPSKQEAKAAYKRRSAAGMIFIRCKSPLALTSSPGAKAKISSATAFLPLTFPSPSSTKKST